MMMVSDMATYHDDGERHGESGDTAEEGRRADESERPGVDPLPEDILRYSAVEVGQQTTKGAPIQAADEAAKVKAQR